MLGQSLGRSPTDCIRRALVACGRHCVATVLLAAAWLAAAGPASAELRDLAAPPGSLTASAPRLSSVADGRTRFSLTLSAETDRAVFALRAPDRLVIDLPEVEWRLSGPDAAPQLDFAAHPGVEKLRVGLFRPGRSRLVLDLGGAPDGLAHRVEPAAGGGVRLIVEFVVGAPSGAPSTGAAPSADATPAPDAAPAPRRAAATALATPASAAAPLFAEPPMRRPTPFVVALDPGHGGRDPGAVASTLREKDIVLAVSLRLREILESDPRFTVAMTRDRDVFVPLEGRVAVAREARAELFLSIHADSLPDHPEVGGASIYTLSERASDRMADHLARSANAADVLAGIEDTPADGDVRAIVVDYKRRVVMDDSHDFAGLAIAELARRIPVVSGRPHRQAGFKVLKNFNAPSVLVELGFLTNALDRRRLGDPKWQETAAQALAAAVRAWAGRDIVEMRMATALAAPY